ncbi:kappaPI-actitoxin-Avd3c-like [Drosophila grimshawi]|uniref:kappaPI-actitoxin-Avd3c-like n=1 Tax=Drosophila grimshawi TaxID=7222 RepID=UPI0013EEF1C4|nr:kappaPI-actitoxin-Avd3c-like [Drosophila grimshawi]
MKLILILACLALYLAHTQAQVRYCRGAAAFDFTQCFGFRDSGITSPVCRSRSNNNMWWFDTRDRTCKQFAYLGCLGNFNRFCTRGDCEIRCRR